MRRRRSTVVLCALVAAGCGSRQPPGVLPAQSSFRLILGTKDTGPADWSGSVEAIGGRVASLAPWRFDKDDRLDAQAGTWKCATRRASVHDPRDWYVGALHVVPQDLAKPVGAMVPNGLHVTLESAEEVRVSTAQGAFRFRPADVRFGEPLTVLDGRAQVERVPAALNLTAGDGMQNDYPALAVDRDSNAWIAWVGYQAEKEKLFVSRADGAHKQVVAEGDFFRPSLVAGPNDRLYLAVSVRDGDTYKIGVATREGSAWGRLEIVSSGGPDLGPRAVVDGSRRLWVVWQGYRDGRSRILARVYNGVMWDGEIIVSENTRNAWEPAAAVDAKGRVHIAWDAYDQGHYDIFYRLYDGEKPGAVRRITTSPRMEAHASVACDKSGRAWIAWDEAGANWGKDTGFLIKQNAGEALYERRRIRAVLVAETGLLAPQMPEDFLEQPQLAADRNGNVWALARRRYVKLHAVYSPSLQRDRLQPYSFWDFVVVRLDGSNTLRPAPLPYSFGRNDQRAAIAAAPAGRLAVAWSGDGRSFAKPYPFVKSEIYSADIPGLAYGEPQLATWTEAPGKTAPVHPAETAQVARVRAERLGPAKNLRILRGDMHRHTDLSFDGDIDGSLWDFYRYALDAADFDYAAVTEHNAGDDVEYFWWLIQKSNDLFHYPGRFTPLYGYERSLRFPNGHRNLIWSRRGVRTLARSAAEEKGAEGAARLYEYLRRTGGIAMSHTSATLMGTDWRDNDPDLEPLVEIYQGDRTSYEYEGAPRAATAREPYSQPGGFQPEGFVWNAWAKGFKLGVQASSDHASTHVSYAVLLAEDLTREAILRAIRARHAYAATDNIVLDVRCGDRMQGDAFSLPGRPRLEVRIEGTAPVDKVEIVRNNKFVFAAKPGKASVQLTWEDAQPPGGERYYYVRVEQRDGQMAWSSPMWIR
ncbi:MAG: hypothetical protein ACRD96_13835 [Bryobacteraceae bacterium]